ncbi:hypothetical protein BKP35_18050 [Anaerobacillus arseniciselenatis]|uniref:Uncharacterized protein n=1 Tax=Anaerobacillus arseniciselenatis TaxID=85682 RepID=A0A1S2L754_9BACI|nr:hypothetical protein [Anaerobacillus arseniciselenatis]OIJ08164.1 hypothetical protein BKP35_18050 [Anaerobacillus arseniciselenatis]
MKKRILFALLALLTISILGCSEDEIVEELEVGAHIIFHHSDESYEKVNTARYSKEQGRDYKKVRFQHVRDKYDSEGNYIHTKIVEEFYENDLVFRTIEEERISYTVWEPQTLFIPNAEDVTEIGTDRLKYFELTEEEKNKVQERVQKLVDDYPY